MGYAASAVPADPLLRSFRKGANRTFAGSHRPLPEAGGGPARVPPLTCCPRAATADGPGAAARASEGKGS